MQRATYLAHLYESVSNIPPDIQTCLLTIAQYGCDPDQVKRWYAMVRNHYGVGEPDSPVSALPQDSMPPPPQPPQGTPTRSVSSTSSQVSPASYHGSLPPRITEPIITADVFGIQQGLPQQMTPWMTPAVSDSGFESGSSGVLDTQASSAPAMGGLFGLSPSFETGGMPFFTGAGLVQVPDAEGPDFSAGALAPRPATYDFAMSSAAMTMPVFVKLEAESSPTGHRGNMQSAQGLLPAKTVQSPTPSEPAQKRLRTTSRQNQTTRRATEPVSRPRRPSMPFRTSGHSTLYAEPAQMPQTPSRPSQQSSYLTPIDLTQSVSSFSEDRSKTHPTQDTQLHQSKQNFYTPLQQLPRQGLHTPEQQHTPQFSRQSSQQDQLNSAATACIQQQSPHAWQPTPGDGYLPTSEAPPYKSPYA